MVSVTPSILLRKKGQAFVTPKCFQNPAEQAVGVALQYNREGDGAAFHYHIGRCNSTIAGGSSPSWTFLFTVCTYTNSLRTLIRQRI